MEKKKLGGIPKNCVVQKWENKPGWKTRGYEKRRHALCGQGNYKNERESVPRFYIYTYWFLDSSYPVYCFVMETIVLSRWQGFLSCWQHPGTLNNMYFGVDNKDLYGSNIARVLSTVTKCLFSEGIFQYSHLVRLGIIWSPQLAQSCLRNDYLEKTFPVHNGRTRFLFESIRNVSTEKGHLFEMTGTPFKTRRFPVDLRSILVRELSIGISIDPK